MDKQRHKALIFSGPSGSGKTTIVKHLIQHIPELVFSVSACTRAKRPNEIDRRDYYFLSPYEFMAKIAQGAFIEWEEVYKGHYYGTLKSEIDRLWALGKTVVFDVDIQGALRLKEYFKDNGLAVYVHVPQLHLLSERLAKRNTERQELIAIRLQKAAYEVSFADKFDITLVNEELEKSLEEILEITKKFLAT